jgi:hypothetical protein
MKSKHLLLVAMAASQALFYSCRKENSLAVEKPDMPDASAKLAASATMVGSVITIAGSNQTSNTGPELADGVGSAARFFFPAGIDLADDGTMYIADFGNSAVRKITPPNNVSTIPIPNRADGEKIYNPQNIRRSANGTLNIIVGTDGRQAFNKHPMWILNTDGSVSTYIAEPNSGVYNCLERDPFGTLFFTQERTLKKFVLNANGRIGANAWSPNPDSLNIADRPFGTKIWALVCANNGIKYMIIGNHLYKLTPSGLFTEIYRDLNLSGVGTLVATKDSRTIYLVQYGAIKALFNGKLQYIAGPNPHYHDGRDGVGSSADVYARNLALSKDESTLYFTDNFKVRKIILR